jgi:hypothetical protein
VLQVNVRRNQKTQRKHPIMNRNLFGFALIGAIAAFTTGTVVPVAVAGPGPQYWIPKVDATPPAAVAAAHVAPRACTDARLAAVTETKPTWPNGRGPLATIEVGKRIECTSCDKPMVMMKPSGHNGRGPMVPVEIKGKHDCTKSGCGVAVASLE